MSAHVNNNSFGNIGRMFARQNMPILYDAKKTAETASADATAETVDNVSLSPQAPRPLSAKLVEEAVDSARVVGGGGKLSSDKVENLRQDRILQAVFALAAMDGGGDAASLPRSWPAGLPAPTREEMEIARRRLTQRLHSVDTADNPESTQQARLDLLRKIGKRDFSGFVAAEDLMTSATGA